MPKPIPITVDPDRGRDWFLAHVEVRPSGCWEWVGHKTERGYGILAVYPGGERVRYLTHRYSWALHHEPPPADLLVCHTCDNPPCVNPEHLFLGTHVDNVQDMIEKGRGPQCQPKEACIRGHVYTPETAGQQARGKFCKICAKESKRRSDARKKLRANAGESPGPSRRGRPPAGRLPLAG